MCGPSGPGRPWMPYPCIKEVGSLGTHHGSPWPSEACSFRDLSLGGAGDCSSGSWKTGPAWEPTPPCGFPGVLRQGEHSCVPGRNLRVLLGVSGALDRVWKQLRGDGFTGGTSHTSLWGPCTLRQGELSCLPQEEPRPGMEVAWRQWLLGGPPYITLWDPWYSEAE